MLLLWSGDAEELPVVVGVVVDAGGVVVGATDDPAVVVVPVAVVVVLVVDSGGPARSGAGSWWVVGTGPGTAVPRTRSALPNATTPTTNTSAALNPAAAHRTRVRSIECW